MNIPPMQSIRDRIADERADAVQAHDEASVRQLDHLIDALKRGMQMTWAMGDLLVSSASTPGVVYTVAGGRCNCPAYKPCKHLKLAELLLDIFETDCETADQEADAYRAIAPRIIAARRVCWSRL